jgi:1,4-dihydroxy-2-naphthoyl-CoA hydrolase
MISVAALNDTMKGLLPEHLGVRLLEAEPERVVGEIVVAEHHCTTPGLLHGGAIMALADTLGAYATAIQLPPGARTTTLESKTNFFAATRVGETLRGETLPLHRGRRTMVWQTTLRNDAGSVAAVVTQTQIVIPAKLSAEQQLGELFRDKAPDDAKALLVRLERAAAAIYEGLAEAASDPAEREVLLANARREHENADALDR